MVGPITTRSDAERERAIQVIAQLAKQGMSTRRIAQKMGKHEEIVRMQMAFIPGEISVSGDGKGAEHLKKPTPLEMAIRVLGNRHRYDRDRGIHLVDGHIVPIGDIFDLAGMQRPGQN